jgi:hypothetical protein
MIYADSKSLLFADNPGNYLQPLFGVFDSESAEISRESTGFKNLDGSNFIKTTNI